jgi:hypothetical protein
MEVTMRGGGILGTIVLVWLIIGVVATWQRGYFNGQETSCASMGTVAVTVIAGPLNYGGVNPKVKDCHVPQLPQPSSMKPINLVPTT